MTAYRSIPLNHQPVTPQPPRPPTERRTTHVVVDHGWHRRQLASTSVIGSSRRPSPPSPPRCALRADWRASAACRGSDPGLFFPERGHGHAEAVRVCASCLVRGECLADALATEAHATTEIFGIRGGKVSGPTALDPAPSPCPLQQAPASAALA